MAAISRSIAIGDQFGWRPAAFLRQFHNPAQLLLPTDTALPRFLEACWMSISHRRSPGPEGLRAVGSDLWKDTWGPSLTATPNSSRLG